MSEKQILPIVTATCHDIDSIFLTYVGPVGAILCEEAFEEWKQEAKTGLYEVSNYIKMLAVQIPDNNQQLQFEEKAKDAISQKLNL